MDIVQKEKIMKKKITAVLLIALVVLSGAFAWGAKKTGPEMMVGIKSGWGMDMTFTEAGNQTITTKIHDVPVLAEFGVDFDAPVSLKASVGGNLFFYSDENYTSDAKGSFSVNLAGAYRYDVSDAFAVKAGLGFGYKLQSWTEEVETIKTSYVYNLGTFSLYADLGASYDVADSFALNFGLTLGGDIAASSSLKVKVGDNVAKKDWDYDLPTNFAFGINLGAAYKF